MLATISPATLADLRRKGETMTLVTKRTPAEFGEVRVDFAHNTPIDWLDLKVVRAVAIGAALAAFGPEALMKWPAIGAGLAGFVGCGLVFAGITDTRGMAMLIARMPWNQASGGYRRTLTACSRAIQLALVLGAVSGTAMAEHTKDSLDVVKLAITQQKAVFVDVREPDDGRRATL